MVVNRFQCKEQAKIAYFKRQFINIRLNQFKQIIIPDL